MISRPIGVWFTVALGVFLASLWADSVLGAKAAEYWYEHHHQAQGLLSGQKLTSVESELSELSAVQSLRLIATVTPESNKRKYLLGEIENLKRLKGRSNSAEIQSIASLDLAFAYVRASLAEEKENNKEAAKEHMRSAQDLFKALGWIDYSEEMLRSMSVRELR